MSGRKTPLVRSMILTPLLARLDKVALLQHMPVDPLNLIATNNIVMYIIFMYIKRHNIALHRVYLPLI